MVCVDGAVLNVDSTHFSAGEMYKNGLGPSSGRKNKPSEVGGGVEETAGRKGEEGGRDSAGAMGEGEQVLGIHARSHTL